MLPDTDNISFEEIENKLLHEKSIRLTIARLDKIHPVISGNKLFKLYYFLKDCLTSNHKTICTFGGAYSNHLVATAFACKEVGLHSIGIVRGEVELTHTLSECIKYGMELRFAKREEYKKLQEKNHNSCNYIMVPQGGYHPTGSKGASLIMNKIQHIKASHICTSTGTATTIAGLIRYRKSDEMIIAVPAIKNMIDIKARINFLNGNTSYIPHVLGEYHFGGYAKKTNELIDFMNQLYTSYNLKTDFIYTGKLFFAIFDQIKKGFFLEGSHIVCLHTGGLQGNLSLPPKDLIF